jgi:hypothetical protein
MPSTSDNFVVYDTFVSPKLDRLLSNGWSVLANILSYISNSLAVVTRAIAMKPVQNLERLKVTAAFEEYHRAEKEWRRSARCIANAPLVDAQFYAAHSCC